MKMLCMLVYGPMLVECAHGLTSQNHSRAQSLYKQLQIFLAQTSPTNFGPHRTVCLCGSK